MMLVILSFPLPTSASSYRYPCLVCQQFMKLYTQLYITNNQENVKNSQQGLPLSNIDVPTITSLCSSKQFQSLESYHIYMNNQDAWELEELDRIKEVRRRQQDKEDKERLNAQSKAHVDKSDDDYNSFLEDSESLSSPSHLLVAHDEEFDQDYYQQQHQQLIEQQAERTRLIKSGKYNKTELLRLSVKPIPYPIPSHHTHHFKNRVRGTCLVYQDGMCILEDGVAVQDEIFYITNNPFTLAYIHDRPKRIKQDQYNRARKKRYYMHMQDRNEGKRVEEKYRDQDMKQGNNVKKHPDRLPKYRTMEVSNILISIIFVLSMYMNAHDKQYG